MKKTFSGLEPAIQNHLKMICETGGLPDGDDSLEALALGWVEKEKAFDDQAQSLGMESVRESEDASRCFLALTYSGFLVAVGPSESGKRRARAKSDE